MTDIPVAFTHPGDAAMASISASATAALKDSFVPLTDEARLLVDAARTINGERQDMYGDAEDSFAVIARYWANHLNAVNRTDDIEIRPRDVAAMMVLFKLAREVNAPKRDNRLDGAGYFGLMERCILAED
ncbi:conserved hypothetical protein [Rhodococcus phage E3]|uniref:hypothetical protein n=1 Tax=Rhodococcus phage E3 TaxID=1007869 RepID=UPI0002C6CE08|nr:hypothetical protein M176_gp177 [Rhodococcus phage E3]AEQ21085.1 conserved hypothetical protein [Rhodococcus phage E3]